MSTSKRAFGPLLRGRIYSALREEGALSFQGADGEAALCARFETTPRRFWKAIRSLERERLLVVEHGVIRYREPAERW